jgi:uncharacterized protein (DUF924 family)
MTTEILAFWFGDWDDNVPMADDDPQMKRWWHKNPEVDALITARFGALLTQDLSAWEGTALGSLAKVVALDQFSRMVYRDEGRAFENDAEARATVRRGLEAGLDKQMSLIQRSFYYMPMMHSEDLADHDLAVELFGKLKDDAAGTARGKGYGMTFEYEGKHRVIIERFGRYPHRNKALGRESTPEETQFLTQPGSSF